MKRLLVLALLSLGICLSVRAQRLPDTVTPESYDLSFTPDLTMAAFAGSETIRVQLLKPTSTVTLNAAELEFQEASITAGGTTQSATYAFDAEKEQVTLTVAKQMPAGPAEIRTTFTGILNDKLRGFYLSKSERRNYAVTQF